MELLKTFYGYKIKNKNLYFAGIKSGRVVWVNDYTYGKAYQEKTAKKIIEKLKKGVLL